MTRKQRGVKDGGYRRRKSGQVCAHVRIGVDAHCEELAVGIHRHFGMAYMVAAMGVGQERLSALAGPLDAAVDLLGGPGQRHVFGVQEDFGAKATTHIGCDHAHLVLGQAQHKSGHKQALNVRILVGDIQRVFLGRAAVHADGGTRLHGVGHQAVVGQVELGDLGCSCKHRIDLALVANRPFIAMVVGRCLVQCRTFSGIAHVHHGRQHVVINVHRFGGVLGLLQRLGNHHGHLIADITCFANRQNGVGRLFHR